MTKRTANSKSVIEYAISEGAGRFLRAIINTPDVFRFDKGETVEGGQTYVTYDVTNMTPFTTSSEGENDVFSR